MSSKNVLDMTAHRRNELVYRHVMGSDGKFKDQYAQTLFKMCI